MNAKKLAFPIVVILQAITVGLLCYAVFIRTEPSVFAAASGSIGDPGPEVGEHRERYGLSAEDAERLTTGNNAETRTILASRHVMGSVAEEHFTIEVGNVLKELSSELQRYESMSDAEKQVFEKKLCDQIMGSDKLKDLVEGIEQCLQDIGK